MKAALSVYVWRNGEDDLLKFSLSIRMRKNGDFSDSEQGVVVGATLAVLSIFKK